MTTATEAFAIDNRVERVALLLDTGRPFVAVKPKGYINPIIGHYATLNSAKRAAARFNARTAADA